MARMCKVAVMLIHCVHSSQTQEECSACVIGCLCGCMWVRDIESLEEAHPRQLDHLGWPVLTGRYVGSFSSSLVLCCGEFFHAVYLNDGAKAPNAL